MSLLTAPRDRQCTLQILCSLGRAFSWRCDVTSRSVWLRVTTAAPTAAVASWLTNKLWNCLVNQRLTGETVEAGCCDQTLCDCNVVFAVYANTI